MTLPSTRDPFLAFQAKGDDAESAGRAAVNLLRHGVTPRQIMTRPAFENAITMVMALGGSTNAVLHLLAIAQAAEVKKLLLDLMRKDESPKKSAN